VETVVYREEVLAIIGAFADIITELRAIRRLLREDYGEEEEDDGG
jgi:hypothetical protein